MKTKIMFVVSVLFLMAMSSLASAGWTSSNRWDQWDDNRVMKDNNQYTSISSWREMTQMKATEKKTSIDKAKMDVMKYPNMKENMIKNTDMTKFHKTTTVTSDTGVMKTARVESISFVRKQNNIVNMRGDVFVGNTHQRIHFDQNVPAGSDLRNLVVHDFVTIAFKQKESMVGGRGMKTYIELVDKVDVRMADS